MAGRTRSLFTRLLPWAALVVMSIAFFLQVAERNRAQSALVRARDDARVARSLLLGRSSASAPARAPAAAASEDVAALRKAEAGLRESVVQITQRLAASEEARRGLQVKADRLDALRATADARADALVDEAAAAGAIADARVAEAEQRMTGLAEHVRVVTSEAQRLDVALTALLRSKKPAIVVFAIHALTRVGEASYAGRVLPLLDHPDPTVRIAALHALLRSESAADTPAVLCKPVLRLLADERADIRLAALFLAQQVVGEKPNLGFGSKDAATAAEIVRLKKKLAAVAGS